MACSNPSGHKNPKDDVAYCCVTEVLEAFCDLWRWLKRIAIVREGTYWEEKVHDVHQAKDHVTDFRLVIAVAGEYQECRNDVMGEHLPVVLPLLLNVDYHDLLQPECVLDEGIPF